MNCTDLDLAVILDRVGDVYALKERCDFAESMVATLASFCQGTGILRVALFTYGDYDHVGNEAAQPPPTWGSGFVSPAELAAMLATLRPHDDDRRDFEAALEQSLALVLDLEWRADIPRVLVTVAGSPPHPPRPERSAYQVTSRDAKDWRQLLIRVHGKAAYTVCVETDPCWPVSAVPCGADTYAAACWRELGKDGWFQARTAKPSHVARVIITLALPSFGLSA